MTYKVLFPYLAQAHQVLHSLPIAVQLAQRHTDCEVHVVGTSPTQMAFIAELLATHAHGTSIHLDGCLRTGWHERGTLARGGSLRTKAYALWRNRGHFRGFDAIVTPERTSLLLKRLGLPNTRLIWTRHGAGDRQIGFAEDVDQFDFVLLAGHKIEQRLLQQGLIRPDDYAGGIYAKFDWMQGGNEGARLFDNQRPTVLYTPHFRPKLSSWPRMGQAVLEYFAHSTRYNLIFAPHIRLFDPPTAKRYAAFAEYQKLPHMHIDLGSTRCVDMSYTRVADLYLGDVSSQVAEFLYQPRACVFLNAHQVAWQEDPNYRFWNLGPVVDELASLDTALDAAFTRHSTFEPLQREYFEDSFGTQPGEPTAARGADAIARFLRRRHHSGNCA